MLYSKFNIENLEFEIRSSDGKNYIGVKDNYNKQKTHILQMFLDNFIIKNNEYKYTLKFEIFNKNISLSENELQKVKEDFDMYIKEKIDCVLNLYKLEIAIVQKVTLLYDISSEEIIKEMIEKASFNYNIIKPVEIKFETDEEQINKQLNAILTDKLEIKLINDKIQIYSSLKSFNYFVDDIKKVSTSHKIIDLCVHSKFIKGSIFRFVSDKLPIYIKPSNVMYFPFEDVALFDKLKLTFDKNEFDYNINIMVDFKEFND